MHGLEANKLCFLTPASQAVDDGLGVTVEVCVIDSKTGPGRHAAFVEKTVGPVALEGGRIARQWLRVAGVKTIRSVEGGFYVETPNYWVARVSLASVGRAELDGLMTAADRSTCEVIARQAKAIRKYAKERYEASNLGSDMRYVNVAGGSKIGERRYSEELEVARGWLEQQGWGRFTSIVPGPLVRATLGKTLTHMPLATGSTYTHLGSAMKEAYMISKGMREPDLELDLQGMQAMHVVAWVQGEPRKRVPLELVRDSLKLVDTSVFWEVQTALLMLVLLFTFARSETPCPKTFSGEGGFDPDKHLQVRDMAVRRHNSRSYLAVRLKAIKQDPRMERSTACGNEDWIIIGEAEGDFNILTWVSHLFRLHAGSRHPDSPFFVDRDRVRPLTYANATRDLRALWARASCGAVANALGPHGLRVMGYNAGKKGPKGAVLAVAHGGWGSDAHERYDRFDMNDVLNLASVIAGSCDSNDRDSESVHARAPEALMPAAPRPDRIRSGTKRQRGCLRQKRLPTAAAPAPAPAHAPASLINVPPKGARVQIYWTEERSWFAGVIRASAKDGTVRVIYDKDHASQRIHERTFVHDLLVERWRLETS